MTNYQNEILDLLPGETPKQKNEFLEMLIKADKYIILEKKLFNKSVEILQKMKADATSESEKTLVESSLDSLITITNHCRIN